MSIIDGRQLAAERKEEVKKERQQFGALSLGVIIATTDTVTSSYVGIKKRAAEALDITVEEYRLPDTCTEADIIEAVKRASKHDGIICQLPIPKGVDFDRIKNFIPLELDVDVLSDSAFEKFQTWTWPAIPPVPAAMKYVLDRNGYSVAGKNVVIVGRGRLVGKPAEVLFQCMDAHTKVLVKGDDVASFTREADVVVLGTGVSHLLTPDMVRDGVVILDAGASELGGKLAGDADPACAEKAALFTPVPGGLGPIAVVEIFANLVALKKAQK